MTSIQPELWVETPGEAVAFYEAAFGATSRTLLVVEDPERIIRQAVGAGATESSPVNNEHAGGSAGSSTHSATNGRSACLWEPGRRAKRRAKIEAEQPPTRPKPTTEDGAFMERRRLQPVAISGKSTGS